MVWTLEGLVRVEIEAKVISMWLKKVVLLRLENILVMFACGVKAVELDFIIGVNLDIGGGLNNVARDTGGSVLCETQLFVSNGNIKKN